MRRYSERKVAARCAVLSLALLLVCCLEARDEAEVDGGEGCGRCHSEEGESAAHEVHVAGNGSFGRAMACGDCHVVPYGWFVEGHVDGIVQVEFVDGGLAYAGGMVPEWDGAKCTNVYCHGASLSGGTRVEPYWNGEGMEDGVTCGDCHGVPPPDPHPSSGTCSQCHATTYESDAGLDRQEHIDGEVDLGGAGDGGAGS